MRKGWFLLAAAMAAAGAVVLAVPAGAAEAVKIGVIYPLTGNAASAGQSEKDAVTLATEIINNAHPELKNLPLGATAGLPNLGGAKIEVDDADHQGNPQVGQQQTLRLITEDHVVAMVGSYHSSVSLVATAVAERQGIPFLVADSVAANITGRGFKWTFRTTPYAPDFAKAYAAFLTELKKSGKKIDNIAVVNENTDYGTSVSASILDAAKTANINVARAYRLQRQQFGCVGAGAPAEVGAARRGDFRQLHRRHHPLFQDDEEPRLPAADHHRRRCRLLRSELHPQCRRSRPGHAQPQRLRHRQAGNQQLHRRSDVQGQIRPRSRRHLGALHAGLPGARRRDQPRRLDRSRTRSRRR